MRPMGLFDLPDHLARLSATGDPLEVLAKVVDFEVFRAPLEAALGYADGSKGGRPPYDAPGKGEGPTHQRRVNQRCG